MVGFILTGHGQFAPGLASAIAMVAGDQPAFTVVPFEGDQAASYGEDLRAAITAMREECDGVLVFTDLLGGTPFNQSMMIARCRQRRGSDWHQPSHGYRASVPPR